MFFLFTHVEATMFNYRPLLELIAKLGTQRYKVKEDVFYEIHPGRLFLSGVETCFIEFSACRTAEPQTDEASILAGRAFNKRVRANPLQHLKFHICLDNTNKDDLDSNFGQGYKIIINILIKYRVRLFKVVKPGVEIAKVTSEQAGKDFTVYCRHNPDFELKHWTFILKEINTKLLEANIQPGIQPMLAKSPFDLDRVDSLIPGTDFITYRIEKGIDPVEGRLTLVGPPLKTKEPKPEDSTKLEPKSM